MGDFASVGQQQSNIHQSQAFAAALQRAKQVAAKIQPNQAQPQGGGSGGFKRSHDDSDSGPESKRYTSPGRDFGQSNNTEMNSGVGGAASMSQALAQAAAVAARLAATAGTTCEEQIRIPECVVNVLMGRGSNETIANIQGESGCKLQLSQDSDQVITLRGSRETVSRGRELIQNLATRNGGGLVEVVLTINMPPPGPTGYPPYQEIMIPGTKVGLIIGKGGDTIKQLQEKTGAKMVIIQDGPNQEVIKPLRISGDPQKIEHAKQLVLDLIAQKDAQSQQQGGRNNSMGGGGMGGGSGGGGGGGGNFNFGGGSEQCEVFVPKLAVGVVIGKGGDMIRKIQTECGCKLQFIQGKNDEPGDRRCLIQGSRQQVDDAKRMIDGLIENVMQRNRGSNGTSGGGSNDNGNSNYGYGYGVNHAQQPAREEITFMVPSAKCGIVIGRGGETIKLINQQSGAYCEMDRNAVNPPSEKLFKCKGTSEQVETARQMISEKINMDIPIISRKPISGNNPQHQQQQGGNYNQNSMQNDQSSGGYQQQQWGGYGQQAGWGDQAQQQLAMGQGAASATAAAAAQQAADYSAQWIEYYKSLGMHREAEAIEQQLKAKQATAGGSAPQAMAGMSQQQQQQQQTPQPQQQQQPAQSADYSAQWAEYYRSIGKIEEAEAIEKQMKQKQNGQPQLAAAAASSTGSNPVGNNANTAVGGVGNVATGGPAAASAGAAGGMPQVQAGYPHGGMTPAQYAQYSQYYAAAAAAGAPGGFPQQAYGGYGAPGGYPGAPQLPQMPGGGPGQQQKNDKN